MTDQEKRFSKNLYDIYTGILFQNSTFAKGARVMLQYDFECLGYDELKAKYPIEDVAGEGSDMQRAERLLHHLAPRLTHSSWYDNHVPQNSLALLDYSYEQPERGINCLNKSKIMAECCLALGIYARRVGIAPYSPYDCDTHVVTEIFDRSQRNWVMLDPTINGYFVDEDRHPLSCLEMRDRMARQETCTAMLAGQENLSVDELMRENIDHNAYFAKNIVCITVERYNGFGDRGDGRIYFVPEHFDLKKTTVEAYKYRIRYAKEHGMGEEIIKTLEKKMESVQQAEYALGDAAILLNDPEG